MRSYENFFRHESILQIDYFEEIFAISSIDIYISFLIH